MDPSVCKGTIFTCRGQHTSQICDMWKQSVNREQHIAAAWNRSRSTKASKDKKDKIPQVDLDTQIKTLQEKCKSHTGTSASEIGGRLALYVGQPLDSAMTDHGHKPVITSSFYRTNGVFSRVI